MSFKIAYTPTTKEKPIKAKFDDWQIARLEYLFPTMEIDQDNLFLLRMEALRTDDPFFQELLKAASLFGSIEIKKVY